MNIQTQRMIALMTLGTKAIREMLIAAFDAGIEYQRAADGPKPGRKPRRVPKPAVVPIYPPTRRSLCQRHPHKYSIRLNRATGMIEGVRADQRARWTKDYPGVDIDGAIRAVAAFYMINADRHVPKNLAREIALTMKRVVVARTRLAKAGR